MVKKELNNRTPDFSGWATRNDVRCSDGRTIKQGAFRHMDGMQVPLVWNHNHSQMGNVLGHAILENRPEGVYTYGFLNESKEGNTAREYIKHGDISALSISANKLKHKGSDVIHGIIREVSLVLAGANPGAFIDTVMIHGEDEGDDAIIYNDENVTYLEHAKKEPEKEPEKEPDKEPDKEPEKEPEKKIEKKVEDTKMAEKTVQDVFNELTEEQKNVVYAMIGLALDEKEEDNDEERGNDNMKHNAFELYGNGSRYNDVLEHSERVEILADAKRLGSLKEAILEHGISDIDVLFPEARNVTPTPETIGRDMDWVAKVMAATKKSPFSRIKSTAVNTTADEARAKGYIKGNKKVEEVITAMKRSTTPTTLYKKQGIDRDDLIDITDFDVVNFMKQEMRVMLNEEIARSILIGDGREASDDDKVNPQNLRPILGDNPLYTIPKIVEKQAGVTDEAFAKEFIKFIIKARKEYKGTGNPTLFTTEDMLTNMLLIEDKNERVIYDTIDKLTTALRVKEIVTVPVMENNVRTNEEETFDYETLAVLVNLVDYTVGADKGGEINFFDDFDIDYNKQKYLIESRLSGALVKPHSAISFELKKDHIAG